MLHGACSMPHPVPRRVNIHFLFLLNYSISIDIIYRKFKYPLFAVTNDELFGIINPATREWKDGLFSVIMRDQANLVGDNAKWIILDGDIDPM